MRAALADAPQAHEQRRVAAPGGGDRAGQRRLQERVEVAGEQQERELVGVAVQRRAPPAALVEVRAAQRPARVHALHERRDVGHGVGRDAVAAGSAALLAQHARQVAVGVEQERVRAIGAHDRVEDQPVDVLREGTGVLQRHVRAVRDAHEARPCRRPACGAAPRGRAPCRLSSRRRGADRCGRRTRATSPGRKASSERSRCTSGTAQGARPARAALVEHDEPVAAQRGLELMANELADSIDG